MVASKLAPLLLVATFSGVLIQAAHSQESTEAKVEAIDDFNPLKGANYGIFSPQDYVYHKKPATPATPSYPSYPTEQVLPPGPGPTKQCTCECDLAPQLDPAGGCTAATCTTSGPTSAGPLCTQASGITFCGTCNSYLNSQNFAFCYDVNPDVAALCYQASCPSTGRISITGIPVTCPDCCGIAPIGSGTSGLFLYGGSYSATNTAIKSDQAVLKFATQCNEGDTYTVCEKKGIILTDTLSFKFVGVYPKECPGTCTQLSCI